MYPYRKVLKIFLILLIFLSFASQALAEPESEEQKSGEESPKVTSKIFILVVDGLQNEVLNKTSVPNINGIANNGVRSTRVVSIFPDTAQTTVASILTGMLPGKHQFVKPGDKLNGLTIQEAMEGKKINTSFFGADGELKKLMAAGGHNCKGPFNNKDEIVINNVLNEWSQPHAYLNIVVLPELRSVLEKHGANSNEYKMAVTKTDNQVGRLLRKLHDENTFETSMIIITGTLGSPPLIMKGLPFKENWQIPPVSICDIAPTVGYLNGIKMDKVNGLVLWNGLKDIPGQDENVLMMDRVKDLSMANANLQEEMWRLEEEKIRVKEQQSLVAREKEDIQRQIGVRDKKISGLENRMNLYHVITAAMVGLFGFGYLILYRLLKKRYLMF